MYKIFVQNIPIHFQKRKELESNVPNSFFPSLKTERFAEFINLLKTNNEPIFIASKDPFWQLQAFFKDFEWIEAAGGIVKNKITEKSLFIFRNGIWDLPKGKIEENESPEEAAIREISEECGLKELKIIDQLPSTFHAYFAYDKYWIKKTHWFNLETTEIETSPQLEEDITETKWFSKNEWDIIRENTYMNILELMNG